MAKIEVAIREAVARGARREVRRVATPLRRELRRLRQVLRKMREDVALARDTAARLVRTRAVEPWRPSASEAELQHARLSPRLIRTLRTRLALSQAALARLVGVSAAAVVQWERGRSTPTDQNRSALIGLRRLGRREVKRHLADLDGAGTEAKGQGTGGAGRRGRGAGRARSRRRGRSPGRRPRRPRGARPRARVASPGRSRSPGKRKPRRSR